MAQVNLTYNSYAPVASSSGQATAPGSLSPVANVLVTVTGCPAGKKLVSFDGTVVLNYGSTAPPVTVYLTIAGATVGSALSFTRVGSTNNWSASRGVTHDVNNSQSIGLKWQSTSGSPSFSDVTLDVVASDWGELK